MSLSPGSRLGSYEMVGPIGAGGIGSVYRALSWKVIADRTLTAYRSLVADRMRKAASR
jgi:hypothetical protein